jgi:hypothetical protein
MFAPADRDASERAPSLQSQRSPAWESKPAPAFETQRAPVFQSQQTPTLQRAVPTQLGSAYGPKGQSSPSAAPSSSAGKSTIPISPFALRPKTVK